MVASVPVDSDLGELAAEGCNVLVPDVAQADNIIQINVKLV
jgi:hypothetical protein